ncbi:MAG: hypothetical protein RL701_5243 [Pseudomonadota bacterium]
MSAFSWLAVVCLAALALLHSLLGELGLIGPLLRHPSFPPLPPPAAFAKATLRFAWHITSIAWLGLAACLYAPAHVAETLAVTLTASGVITYAATRGRHFAWAVFFVGALAALADVHHLDVGRWVGIGAGVVLAGIAALHVAWACGLRWGLSAALPEVAGKRAFSPSPLVTVLVAIGLCGFAGVALTLAHALVLPVPSAWLHAGGCLAAGVFGLRTVGDLRVAGLFKRVHGTRFARLDDMLFTPLCFALCAAFVVQLSRTP